MSAEVAQMLRNLGYACWTADEAGLNEVPDDMLTVYAADKNAILVSHDREFSQRRARNVIGRHIQLRCPEWVAAELMKTNMDSIMTQIMIKEDILVQVSDEGIASQYGWS